MVFSSTEFLFLFLPVVLTGYYLLHLPAVLMLRAFPWRRACNLFLLLMSLAFYFCGEAWLVWIVITSTLIDYTCGLIIAGGGRGAPAQLDIGGPRTPRQRFGLILSICSNMAFLGVFKYFNFGIDSYNAVLGWLGLGQLGLHDVIEITLPLGISFYTFQSMSYTIDVYRGKVPATRHLVDFACYVTMFPQLVAGPIVRYSDVARQLAHRTLSLPQFTSGVCRFVVGLTKKVLVANVVAVPVDRIFAMPLDEITAPVAWLGAIGYAIQIYFDFSGYSDMAIGLGRMFGFEYLENFRYPYIARSMREFWRRWHISLSTWFRDYLYVPLGGSRRSKGRTYVNLVTVFFLCGLWHGAEWTFVVWGLYHGLFLVCERFGPIERFLGRHRLLGHAYTLVGVLVGWVIFRSESFWQSYVFLRSMAGLSTATELSYTMAYFLTPDVCLAIAFGVVFSMPICPVLLGRVAGWSEQGQASGRLFQRVATVIFVIGIIGAMTISAMSLSTGSYNPFIYFRF